MFPCKRSGGENLNEKRRGRGRLPGEGLLALGPGRAVDSIVKIQPTAIIRDGTGKVEGREEEPGAAV
jgi:hypothetical protein